MEKPLEATATDRCAGKARALPNVGVRLSLPETKSPPTRIAVGERSCLEKKIAPPGAGRIRAGGGTVETRKGHRGVTGRVAKVVVASDVTQEGGEEANTNKEISTISSGRGRFLTA